MCFFVGNNIPSHPRYYLTARPLTAEIPEKHIESILRHLQLTNAEQDAFWRIEGYGEIERSAAIQ
jgi:hypothetical protein